jgi:hypothetical protein
MNVKGIRIGNYLMRLDDTVFVVSSDDIQIIDKWSGSRDLLPKPVPLTKEWMLKFHFNIDPYKNYELNNININRKTFEISIFTSDNWITIPVKIEYVHQLQNLYFDLTGEEL